MEVEYTIRFVEGAVVITEKRKWEAPPNLPVAAEHHDLGSSSQNNSNEPPLPVQANGGKRPPKQGGGELGSDRTGGGWGASGCGITVVFGAVYCTTRSRDGSGELGPDGPNGNSEN